MSNNLIKVCYEGSEGASDIRTIKRGDVLFISLIDVQIALNKENRSIDESHSSKSMIGIINGLIRDLDNDEYILIPNEKMSNFGNKEMFVTQPGLFRVLTHDKSFAGKKFQRWLFHEVVPSLTKYGVYPPPLVQQDSDVMRMAKTLLMEIEQREELERKTKLQFAKHEQAIRTLSTKLSTLEITRTDIEFSSVHSYCLSNDLADIDQQLIQGWCIKLCAETSEPTSKTIIDGELIPLFPVNVIVDALRNIERKN